MANELEAPNDEELDELLKQNEEENKKAKEK